MLEELFGFSWIFENDGKERDGKEENELGVEVSTKGSRMSERLKDIIEENEESAVEVGRILLRDSIMESWWKWFCEFRRLKV